MDLCPKLTLQEVDSIYKGVSSPWNNTSMVSEAFLALLRNDPLVVTDSSSKFSSINKKKFGFQF